MILVRAEVLEDYDEVYQLVKRVFEKAEHTDGDEQDLVVRLHKSDAFIPELSLVAEENGKIVGHIMFTKAKVGSTTQLCLAPLAVSCECQGKGIGGKLIEEGHKIAKNLGFEYSILIGYPNYYSKFGYKNASNFGISAPFEVSDGVFMAMNLQEKNTQLNGQIEFAKEFFEK